MPNKIRGAKGSSCVCSSLFSSQNETVNSIANSRAVRDKHTVTISNQCRTEKEKKRKKRAGLSPGKGQVLVLFVKGAAGGQV